RSGAGPLAAGPPGRPDGAAPLRAQPPRRSPPVERAAGRPAAVRGDPRLRELLPPRLGPERPSRELEGLSAHQFPADGGDLARARGRLRSPLLPRPLRGGRRLPPARLPHGAPPILRRGPRRPPPRRPAGAPPGG